MKISALTIKDVKTRRFFILADGQKSCSEIFRLCCIDEQTGMRLLQVLLDEGCLRVAETSSEKKPKPDQHSLQSDVFIEDLTRELANYVGPFAQVVMHSIDLPEKEICKEDRRKIINVVMQEIESESDRRNFLSAALIIGGN
jgi:hypothetical protein